MSAITLSMTPSSPATGCGHIEQGDEDGGSGVYRVQRFTEKPDADLARDFLSTGRYLWNSGMFIWRLEVILNAFETLVPELYGPMLGASRQRGGLRQVYPTLPKISVDYAILERTRNVAVGRHVSLDTGGAIMYTTGGEDLIATIGLEDVVVVRAGDVTLVVRKDRTQDIKKVVAQLKDNPEPARFA
ncbi:sugar phosphate nucleotidyltransferase [Deinococcus daejeonensis]|nr:sugar phosphate nucleotidyltransferase [Deinococcus daejeonensis]